MKKRVVLILLASKLALAAELNEDFVIITLPMILGGLLIAVVIGLVGVKFIKKLAAKGFNKFKIKKIFRKHRPPVKRASKNYAREVNAILSGDEEPKELVTLLSITCTDFFKDKLHVRGEYTLEELAKDSKMRPRWKNIIERIKELKYSDEEISRDEVIDIGNKFLKFCLTEKVKQVKPVQEKSFFDSFRFKRKVVKKKPKKSSFKKGFSLPSFKVSRKEVEETVIEEEPFLDKISSKLRKEIKDDEKGLKEFYDDSFKKVSESFSVFGRIFTVSGIRRKIKKGISLANKHKVEEADSILSDVLVRYHSLKKKDLVADELKNFKKILKEIKDEERKKRIDSMVKELKEIKSNSKVYIFGLDELKVLDKDYVGSIRHPAVYPLKRILRELKSSVSSFSGKTLKGVSDFGASEVDSVGKGVSEYHEMQINFLKKLGKRLRKAGNSAMNEISSMDSLLTTKDINKIKKVIDNLESDVAYLPDFTYSVKEANEWETKKIDKLHNSAIQLNRKINKLILGLEGDVAYLPDFKKIIEDLEKYEKKTGKEVLKESHKLKLYENKKFRQIENKSKLIKNKVRLGLLNLKDEINYISDLYEPLKEFGVAEEKKLVDSANLTGKKLVRLIEDLQHSVASILDFHHLFNEIKIDSKRKIKDISKFSSASLKDSKNIVKSLDKGLEDIKKNVKLASKGVEDDMKILYSKKNPIEEKDILDNLGEHEKKKVKDLHKASISIKNQLDDLKIDVSKEEDEKKYPKILKKLKNFVYDIAYLPDLIESYDEIKSEPMQKEMNFFVSKTKKRSAELIDKAIKEIEKIGSEVKGLGKLKKELSLGLEKVEHSLHFDKLISRINRVEIHSKKVNSSTEHAELVRKEVDKIVEEARKIKVNSLPEEHKNIVKEIREVAPLHKSNLDILDDDIKIISPSSHLLVAFRKLHNYIESEYEKGRLVIKEEGHAFMDDLKKIYLGLVKPNKKHIDILHKHTLNDIYSNEVGTFLEFKKILAEEGVILSSEKLEQEKEMELTPEYKLLEREKKYLEKEMEKLI